MNPNHLLTFAVVARLQSITQAAELLHLGQPAVSGQLKLLQKTVGEPLYERKGYKIVLTPAGNGLLKFAEQMESDLKQAKEYVKCLQRVNTGALRIGSTATIASYYLPRFVVQLQTAYAGVQVFMKTGNTREILQNLNELDLVFIEGPIDAKELPGNFQVLPWQEDEIVLVLPERHPLIEKYPDGAPLTVFNEHQAIWREAGSGARDVVEQALMEANIEVPVTIEVSGVSGIKEAVRAGMGISFASSLALRHERTNLIGKRLNPPTGLTWHLNIIAQQPALQSRTAKAFLDLCCNKNDQQ